MRERFCFLPARRALATLAAGVLVAVGLAAAPASAEPPAGDTGRITTTIGSWRGSSDGFVVVESTPPGLFSIPAPGTSGTIEYTVAGVGTFCLDSVQTAPYSMLTWTLTDALVSPCQDVTTVVDALTGLVGFAATDGPYQGRYLGDFSGAGIVDWDQDAFFGITVPGVDDVPVTPAAPVLVPAETCGVEPTVQVPETAGAVYSTTRSGSTVVVDVVADAGYAIPSGAVTHWELDVTAVPCPPEPEPAPEPEPLPVVVTPVAPVLGAAEVCGAEPEVSTAETEGVTYTRTRDGSTVTVSAVAVEGYEVASGAVTRWAFDVAAEPCPTVAPTTPAPSPGSTSQVLSAPDTTAPVASSAPLARTGAQGAGPLLSVALGAVVVGATLTGIRVARGRRA